LVVVQGVPVVPRERSVFRGIAVDLEQAGVQARERAIFQPLQESLALISFPGAGLPRVNCFVGKNAREE
jgi:hypothetical protein